MKLCGSACLEYWWRPRVFVIALNVSGLGSKDAMSYCGMANIAKIVQVFCGTRRLQSRSGGYLDVLHRILLELHAEARPCTDIRADPVRWRVPQRFVQVGNTIPGKSLYLRC